MHRTIVALATAALFAAAARAEKEAEARDSSPTMKVLKAVVLEVRGAAQWRPGPKAKWKKAEVNDALEPGAVVRTGRKSRVVLRVGKNASILIDRQSRVAIPEIVEEKEVLRTRVALAYGRTDVKVDKVGLLNDFEVSTPAATLAVKGTKERIEHDVVAGTRASGNISNALRAAEVSYARSIRVLLSRDDETSEEYERPAFHAYVETIILPAIGELTDVEAEAFVRHPRSLDDPVRESGLEVANQRRGNVLDEQQRNDGDTVPFPPNPGIQDPNPPSSQARR